jgi:alpha-amylase
VPPHTPHPTTDATSAPSEGALGRLHGWLGFGGWSLSGARQRDGTQQQQQQHPASLQALVVNTVGPEAVSVGETDAPLGWDAGAVWDAPASLSRSQDACRQALCDWIDAHSASAAARDAPTAALLRRAAATQTWSLMSDARGKAPGLIGWWPSKAVTYVEGDSSAQSSVDVPPELLPACYAYVLTHPGLPSVPLSAAAGADASLAAAVAELLALRRRAGVRSDAGVSIMRADDDSYLGIVTGSDAQVCVKLGPRYTMAPDVPFDTDGWKLAAQGRHYAVWERPLSSPVGMR